MTNDIPRTTLWARGVDATQFNPGWRLDAGTRALRRSLAPDGEVLVGYVGRLAPEKELQRLTALAGLPGLRVVLVGDGPTRAQDAAALAAAGVDAVFLGRREGDDLARAYAALNLFVHTGTRETFGQTLQEAAATGLPVIAPARGGPLDLVDHSRTGLLFDPDDPRALRSAVVHLAGDGTKRRAMGEAARVHVAGRSWAALTDQLLGHYADASGPGRSSAGTGRPSAAQDDRPEGLDLERARRGTVVPTQSEQEPTMKYRTIGTDPARRRDVSVLEPRRHAVRHGHR